MSTKAMKYVHESLAATGFVVMHHEIAATVRPDIWGDGMECRKDIHAQTTRNALGGLKPLRYRAILRGIQGAVPLLARSPKQLAERIELITGFQVDEVFPESELEGIPEPMSNERLAAIARRKVSLQNPFDHIKTANGPRSCSTCSHIAAGHRCMNDKVSGIDYPPANVDRRCLGYAPLWNSHDKRNGHALWPELINATPILNTGEQS